MPKSPSQTFPKNFVWGAATAAAQIEGAAYEDGKGESVWDHFARQPGRVLGGDNLDVACDHYHRFQDDVHLLRDLGVRNYRFSVAWPRVFPQGDGALNQKGLDFYSRLVDALLAAGITPWVTLFHWDLPQALEERGGWRKRLVLDAFGPYVDAVVKALGDRVKNWITLNEIICFTTLGHDAKGDKAPGTIDSPQVVNQTIHHALLCHGRAVQAVRAYGGRGARVGLTDNSSVAVPLTETPEDIAAARTWFAENNAHILDPLFTGRYSPAYLRRCGADRPKVERGDLELISQPTDFLGLNIYTGTVVRAGKKGKPEAVHYPAEYPRTASPWHAIVPPALYWGPRLVADVYGAKNIYITENGAGYDQEKPNGNGQVNDLMRQELLRAYLRELQRAADDKVPVRGYFLWSFMDNFEWQDGYQRRFGLVHVDYQTQVRTPKLSARWYKEVMQQNRVV